jgi:hypothetical protein
MTIINHPDATLVTEEVAERLHSAMVRDLSLDPADVLVWSDADQRVGAVNASGVGIDPPDGLAWAVGRHLSVTEARR